MLAGYPPFTASTNDEVWVNVYHYQKVLERPWYEGDDIEFNFSDFAWDLIKNLVCEAGVRICTLAMVCKHPFFRGMSFEDVRLCTPPFIPALKYGSCIRTDLIG